MRPRSTKPVRFRDEPLDVKIVTILFGLWIIGTIIVFFATPYLTAHGYLDYPALAPIDQQIMQNPGPFGD
jgi:hypothetical protein